MGGYAAGRKIIRDLGSEITVWVYSRELLNGYLETALEIQDEDEIVSVEMTIDDWEWLKQEADDAIAFLKQE